MGALSALGLMMYLPLMTWVRLLVWFLVGIVIYFGYSYRRSKLQQPTK
jgi:APA family basic amino acid/polyamine antiporter